MLVSSDCVQPSGQKGDEGDKGQRGPQGFMGPKGDRGFKGEQQNSPRYQDSNVSGPTGFQFHLLTWFLFS